MPVSKYNRTRLGHIMLVVRSPILFASLVFILFISNFYKLRILNVFLQLDIVHFTFIALDFLVHRVELPVISVNNIALSPHF